VTEKGSVTPTWLSSPVSVAKPVMSSGLCAINAESTTLPARPTSTDQPSFGRLSSSTLPLHVMGCTVVADPPPAPW
jgi:hypothetical protein